MKKWRNQLVILSLGLLSHKSVAQHSISGKCIDQAHRPVPYLDVIASRGDRIARGTLTDSAGVFRLALPDGSYTLSVTFLGKKLFEKQIAFTQSLQLGAIQVNTDMQLKGVVVSTRKKLIEQKVDRLVFNVANSLAAAGGDALDALRITPGLRVQNDQISMIGKGSLRVMVDGRILPLSGSDLTDYLQSISADDIERIEVVTTPPARYEAEGDSGLINIIYKKGRKNAWNANLKSSYLQTTYPAYVLGGTFSYRKNKLSLWLHASAKTGAEAVIEKYHIRYPTQPWIGRDERKDKKDYLSNRVALDYSLSEKTTIGFQYLCSMRNPDIRDQTTFGVYNTSGALDSLIQTRGFNDKKGDNQALNGHYVQTWDTTGKKLSIDLDYFKHHQTQDRHFISRNYPPDDRPMETVLSAENASEQDIDNYSAKLDITYPTRWARLSYGAKASFTDSDNAVDFFNTLSGKPVRDPEQSDRFEYRENTQALYFSASKKLSDRWEAQLGLRLENTQTQGISTRLDQSHKNDYSRLFPTCYLTHDRHGNQAFSLRYSRRIERPPYWRLNPFRWYMSASVYAEGNPYLQPSFTDNIEFSHSWKDALITRASCSITHDGFNRIPEPDDETKKQVWIDKNYYTRYHYSLSVSHIFKKYSWWQSYNQAYLYYNRSELDRKEVDMPEQGGLGFYMHTNNSLLLNAAHTWQAEVDFWYRASNQSDIFEEDASYSLDLACKLFLLDKRLQLSLGTYDIFKTSSADYTTRTNGIEQTLNSYFDNRYFVLSLRFKFGNDKIAVKQRAFGSQSEKERAGG